MWITCATALLLIAAAALAGQVDTPHTFTPGTVADANQVNENFAALEAGIDDNDTRIAANQAAVEVNATALVEHDARLGTCEIDIGTCETEIDANVADILTNATDIATNAASIATNGARLTAIETGAPVSGLDADKLDGLHASDLIRAAYAESTTTKDNWRSTSYDTLVSKSVTVPANGILLIWAAYNGAWDIDSSTDSYIFVQSRITVGGVEKGITQMTEFWDNLTALDLENTTHAIAVPVTAGSTTVALEARLYSGSAYAVIMARSLTTLFVPFGNGGTQGTLNLTGFVPSNESTEGSGFPWPRGQPVR